ncbi:MAG: ARMT1-like domain-containing protein [Kiritimatiellia bacterium]|nr:ARMT1-like domain-containing protein [Kiritimatiellia bacterium]
MNAVAECVPCLAKQALQVVRASTSNPELQAMVMQAVCQAMGTMTMRQSASHYSMPAYAITAEMTGVADPYAQLKRESNATAIRLLPRLRKLVETAEDPLAMASRIAISGNIIDAGVTYGFDIEHELAGVVSAPFGVNDLALFNQLATPGKRLLYLCDNAGEIVFDRLLIEHLLHAGLQVTAVVKAKPIINDAMMEDAQTAGLMDICPVIDSGCGVIGINWDVNPPELRDLFNASDLVIAKGHGHFETLDEETHPGLFCLLKVKCPIVANRLSACVGDLIFSHIPTLNKGER